MRLFEINGSQMNSQLVKNLLLELGMAVNKRCREVFANNQSGLNKEVKISPADIIYQIDLEAEEEIVNILNSRGREFGGIELIAEGIGEDDLSFYPEGQKSYALKIICDPIDGSRGLMYGKRPAFFLAAAGPAESQLLSDMSVSVMVELPIPKQGEFDILSSVRGEGVAVIRQDLSGNEKSIDFELSKEKSVEGGFMSFAKFCYPGKDLIAKVEEQFLDELFSNRPESFLPVFDDQYISTGGQLYELIAGHDRFTVDFRAAMYRKFRAEGKREGQVCHPYDMAGLLIAREFGLIIEDLDGKPFDCPLTTDISIDWVGFANEHIKEQCRALLAKLLKKEGVI